jgi:spore coat polysaccharide biosynthesis protein SpsF
VGYRTNLLQGNESEIPEAAMKPRVVLIIQARMGSARLPGKSMMDLAGAPLVGRILERVKRCRQLDDIVLAVPDDAANTALAALGEEYGVKVFAGSEDDLVDRFYQAARWMKADVIGRLPADNATPEPGEIDRIVDFHLSLGRPGFSSNLAQIGDSGYPDGIGAEMFDFSLLEDVRARQPDERRREHVHLNFFDYATGEPVDAAWCPVRTIKCPEEFRRPDVVLDVNTSEQYEFMRELYEYLYPRNPEFHITDTIRWYDDVYLKSKNQKEA